MSTRLLDVAKTALDAINAASRDLRADDFVSGVTRSFRRSGSAAHRTSRTQPTTSGAGG